MKRGTATEVAQQFAKMLRNILRPKVAEPVKKPHMKITRVSENGINFIIKEEGMVLKPYRDAVGIPTIGVGSTFYEDGRRVQMTDPPITRERAVQLFKNILKQFEDGVSSTIKSNINQNQFDALVSLAFNIGVAAFARSTVARLVNKNPDDPAITEAFKMWRNAGGKPILLNRRIREARLYFLS